MNNSLGEICNQQLARFSCEFVLCRLKIVSLASSANFNLEYNPAGEIRLLACERQREANLFETTTTNFNKQNSKLKPQHILHKSNFITTANLVAFH